MENESAGSPPAAAASCPPWVMLNRYGYHRHSIVAETKITTAAAACTSTNLLVHVSLLLAAPPASSWLHYGWRDSTSSQDAEGEEVDALRVTVIASHGSAVLLETGTVRPPSLLKLPSCYFPYLFEPDEESLRVINVSDTGLLHCGEDDLLLVAHLEVSHGKDEPRDRADLCILRLGQEWEHKQAVPIIFDDHQCSKGDAVMWRWWQADTAVPVGDRYLCWVDYLLGFLFCDMAADDASLKLRYMTLPVLPPKSVDYFDGGPYMRYCRHLAGSDAGVVRFVNIEPRCSCGGHGRSTCARGQFLFTVTTWTLSLSMDEPLEWVKDGVLDCDQLWALPAYKGLPQVPVKFPLVSLENPDVIWLMVPEDMQDCAKFADRRVWMVEVDTRNKALLSVVPYTDSWRDLVAVKLRC